MNENVFQPSVNEDGEKGFFVNEIDAKGLNFTTEKQRKANKKRLEKEHNRNNVKFTNTNINEIDYICDNLTNAQIGYLMVLQCYISYEGALIHSQKNHTPLKSSDLQKILGLVGKRQTFYDFKNKCLNAGILIYDGQEKTYSINEKFIFKGAFKGMGIDVVSMVTKEIKNGLNEAKPEELAMIFKLQKFVNFNTMALVKNSNQTNLDKLEFMKQKDLAQVLGVSPSHLSRKLYQIVVNNEYIIAKIKVGKEPTKFMLNPKVFFRGNYTDIQENVTVDVAPFFKVRRKN